MVLRKLVELHSSASVNREIIGIIRFGRFQNNYIRFTTPQDFCSGEFLLLKWQILFNIQIGFSYENCIIVEDNTQDGGVFMGKYKPPFTITNKILSYVSSISEKIGQITAIKILDEISAQIRENDQYLPESVQKLFQVMEYDVPYTSNVLMEKLGLKAKEGFRRNYLHPAIEMNLIRMTIPDKPNSRNQRYVRI